MTWLSHSRDHLYLQSIDYTLAFFTWTGYSCHNFGCQAWTKPRIVKKLFNFGCSCTFSICSSFWMVMGATWMDSPKWDISIRNPIGRAKYHSCSKPSVHFHYRTGFLVPSMFIQVWDLSVFRWLDSRHDHLCCFVPTWDQGNTHWGDVIYLEETLVLEKDTAGWCRSTIPGFWNWIN